MSLRARGPCRHCKRDRLLQGRGLCAACYDRPDVRAFHTPFQRKPEAPPCRHCKVRPGGRARGLCFSCYRTPEVRALYPSTSIYARKGAGVSDDFRGERPPPEEATRALPGTPEKAMALAERAKAGVALWHERDAAYEDGSTPGEDVSLPAFRRVEEKP